MTFISSPYACYRCNEFKGAKTDAIDPETGQFVPLFNPRTQRWSDQFAWVNVVPMSLEGHRQVERRSLH